jgi:RNA polymerase-binding transcription factor DksA
MTIMSAAEEKTRYTEEELKEFETLLLDKLDKAKHELNILKQSLNRSLSSGTNDTNITSKVLEDGAETSQKENVNELAARQQKFINNLNNALIRIKNGTYGVCKVTGKLIPKERLRAVPHTMMSIEAKLQEKK